MYISQSNEWIILVKDEWFWIYQYDNLVYKSENKAVNSEYTIQFPFKSDITDKFNPSLWILEDKEKISRIVVAINDTLYIWTFEDIIRDEGNPYNK